jgi:hypothetical protein
MIPSQCPNYEEFFLKKQEKFLRGGDGQTRRTIEVFIGKVFLPRKENSLRAQPTKMNLLFFFVVVLILPGHVSWEGSFMLDNSGIFGYIGEGRSTPIFL